MLIRKEQDEVLGFWPLTPQAILAFFFIAKP
jgi:hypothetical protein